MTKIKLKKNRKLFILFLAFFFINIVGISQSNKKTFHLKNGSVVTGTVIEEVPGKQYKVKTSDGNIFVFTADEIETIVLVEEPRKKQSHTTEKGISFYTLNELSFAGMFYADEQTYSIGASTINGVCLNEQIYLGIGLEYQYLSTGYLAPIFLDLRLNFHLNDNNSVITYINGGVVINGVRENIMIIPDSFSSYEKAINYENGYLGRVGLGYKSNISEKLNANVSLFYAAESYSSNTWLYEDQYLKTDGIYSMIGIKLGIGIN